MKKALIITYTGMTIIDAGLMVILFVNVYDVHLYERPNCKDTSDPCQVSMVFKIVVGSGAVFFLLKALGLIFAFYRIKLVMKENELKEDDLREKLR